MKFTPIMAALSATLLLGAPTQALAADKFMANHVKTSGVVGLKASDNRSEVSTYIVELHDQPVATYTGGISGLQATQQTLQSNVAAKKKSKKIAKEANVARYLAHLEKTQNDAVSSINQVIKTNVKPVLNYRWALNGFSVEMTAAQAEKAAHAPGVKRIYKDQVHQLQTDTGPAFIGADKVWQGTATGVEAKGEGVLVGIIDSGINTDNDSFKATGDDGYTHINPFSGYLGDCEQDASLCNDKLVGVISFPEVTGAYNGMAPANGEDMNGHGSHTAGTTAGNVLKNVPILKASDQSVSDGEQIGTAEFGEIAGVAPHANIISYQTCNPEGACYDSLTVKAVDMAIEHGVDVINFSIGPGGDGGSPWESASAWAFLKAREAGIFVAAAAGNAGNGESTVGNVAPWTTVVANYTHDRIFEKSISGTDDNSNAAPALKGVGGLGEEVTAPVIYAGDLTDDYGTDFSLCGFSFYDYFPELEGAVVICDRGDFALMEKAQNVSSMGGVGVIIRNTPTSGTNLYNVPYSIPGVLIDQESGESLLSWVHESTNPTVSLSGGEVASSELMANTANFSSSRGPSLYAPENMVPHIAAPGTDIYAAYSDDRPFNYEGGATDFAFLSGTSMASPHVAGSAALLTQLHPSWTPAQMQSAMMMTANTNTRKEDLTTASNIFDHGAGMINVAAAAKAGLLLDETIANYRDADPLVGGDPTTLNVPYMVDSNCWGECSFTRTFTVERDGKWTLSLPANDTNMTFEVSPASFEASAGDSVEVTVNVSFEENVSDEWAFTQLTLTEAADNSVLALPVGIQPMVAQIEQWKQVELTRSSGDLTLEGYRFRRPAKIEMDSYRFFKAESFNGAVAADSNNMTFLDNLQDGVQVFSFDVAPDTQRIGAVIGQTNGFDMDLFIGWDSNGDGIPQDVEILCGSTAENKAQYEACSIDKPVAGKYWVLVWNWWSASEGSVDEFRVDVLRYLESDIAEISVEAPNATEAYADYPIAVSWEGDLDNGVYYGALDFTEKGDDGAALYLGDSNIIIDRSQDAVMVAQDKELVAPGDYITYTIHVANVSGSEEVTFDFSLAEELELVSSTASPSINGNTLSWQFTASNTIDAIEVVAMVKDNQTGTMNTNWAYSFASLPDESFGGKVSVVNPNNRPVAVASTSLTNARVNNDVELSAQGSSDADGDSLTYHWEQIAGETVSLTDISTVSPSFVAPSLSSQQNLVFQVTVSDGQLTSQSQVTVTVEKDKDGGTFGGFMLAMLGLFVAGRRVFSKPNASK